MAENTSAKSSIQVLDATSSESSFENSEPGQGVQTVRPRFAWGVIGPLALLTLVGFGFRASQLGAIGFAEDEANKVEAVEAYERGDFTANAEHPMLMKALPIH